MTSASFTSRELLGCDASSYDVRRRDVPGHNCLRGFSGRALRGKAGKSNISGRLAQADDNAVLHSATRRECEPVSPPPAARCISTRGRWTDRLELIRGMETHPWPAWTPRVLPEILGGGHAAMALALWH